ncbi:hypothetical protein C0993_010111 [Termitomyces sp. T159_Od127]|nr:hypothetical protein C0993_010111 [Termitomyces sp. T159_Od127]
MAILPQRPLRGSRISTFYPVKSLPSLASLDSAFQLQEYISLLIRLDVHDVEAITSLPGKRAGKEKEANIEGDKSDDGEDDERGKNEPTVDEACWIYEQLRRLAQDLTHPLITMLQQECTRASCPEMKAGEWLYLCVAHGTDGNVEQCCAIDYILHTLDSATALLNTPRAFPSRSIQIPQSSHRHFSSLARRLGRIFAHAYFHHREAFEQAEAESSLYARFLVLTSKFDLVPSEFLVIPAPSSTYSDSDHENDDRHDIPVPRLLGAAVDQRGLAEGHWSRRNIILPVETRTKSVSPPKLSNCRGSDSPRKLGRSRTDTMVLHDAYAVAEELAKASPKVPVPLLEAMEEPMSPMDEEDLPTTAKPVVECLEDIGESLPESPILHSPPPPIALSLLPEPPQEEEAHPKELPNSAAVSPATASEAERTTTDLSLVPVEADIVENLASTGVETETSVIKSRDTIEDALKESEEEPKETVHLADVVAEKVQEENKEEIVESAHVPEAAKEDPPGTLEVPLGAAAPTPASQHTDELDLTDRKGSISAAAQAEKSAAVHNGTLESETIVEIPDEMEALMAKVEAIKFIPETESPVGNKPEEKLTQAKEKISASATEPDNASPS